MNAASPIQGAIVLEAPIRTAAYATPALRSAARSTRPIYRAIRRTIRMLPTFRRDARVCCSTLGEAWHVGSPIAVVIARPTVYLGIQRCDRRCRGQERAWML